MSEIRILEIETVIAANEQFVGPNNLTDFLRLQSAVGRQTAGYGESHFYPTVAAKAGALLHGLIQNHPFVDGNKRTALWAAAVLAGGNGFELDGTTDDLVDLVVRIAAESWPVERVIEEVERRLRPL